MPTGSSRSAVKAAQQSRLITAIVGLIAVACVLAAILIYMQGVQVAPSVVPSGAPVLSQEAKAQYISKMQVQAQSATLSASTKAAMIAAMAKRINQ